MSRFLTPLDVRLADPRANDHTGQWWLLSELRYQSDRLGEVITVPRSFSTDFASVPRESAILWGLFGGRGMRAAVVHDYITRQRLFRRERCDRVFLEALLADGMEASKALPMYLAVVAYTASGLWQGEWDRPGYEPIG